MASDARDFARRLVNDDRMPPSARRAALASRMEYRRATRRLRALPTFIIVGCHKGGTTALYDYLAAHPQVIPSLEKEVHYFDVAYDGDPDTYRVQFPVQARVRLEAQRQHRRVITGEASPYYLAYPHAPSRVAGMLPDVRLIALLRDPVTRALSAFHHNRRRTPYEPLERFEDAVDRELTLFADERDRVAAHPLYNDRNYARYCYLRRGCYAEHLAPWFEHFPREQMLVLQSERLSQRPAETYASVLDHIGLDRWEPEAFLPSNTNTYPDMDEALLHRLIEWYRPHNERLFELLGTRFDWLGT